MSPREPMDHGESRNRDRAALLIAAGRAAESLESRVDHARGPTLTLSVDEARELAEQFGRVVAILTVLHLEHADARPGVR